MGYAPHSAVLDTEEAIAARGGGLYPFSLRPAKEKVKGMRRTVLLLASTALAVLLASGAALAEEKIDQQNTGPIRNSYDHEEFSGDDQYFAQSFTAGKTGKLSKVSVQIEKDACGTYAADGPYKNINVRIYALETLTGTLTTGSSLRASTTLPASQVPYQPSCDFWRTPPWTDVTFDPDTRPQVSKGRKYAVALEFEPVPSDSSVQPPYSWYYDYGYSYEGGDGHQRYVYLPGLSFPWTELGIDFKFSTYVDVPDTDGDGLADDVDLCDDDPGPESNNGCPLDTVRPTGSVVIEGGANRINFRTVTLTLDANDPSPGTGVASMRLKNAGGSWTAWQPYAASKDWKLTRGAGKKTVYARYRDAAGNVSARASDSITYRP